MKRHWIQGSYTVEAAMIMGIVLFSIITVIQSSLFVYERAVETAKAYEEMIKTEIEEPDPVTYVRRMQAVGTLTGK